MAVTVNPQLWELLHLADIGRQRLLSADRVDLVGRQLTE
jgi:hypothetical protein